ncbi:endonuclease [Marivirga lumbricoides]|uniref:Endonuclease n=1 Tax=Marivirga lumbricoides TaxID=1046115 RepID=A0ABQ1NA22_9BACT|nr:endonuclease [Marivirga lumbricoides]
MTNKNYNNKLQPFANSLRKNMTKAEACLWKYVLKARMMKGYQFRRQRPVLNYIADFMCKELNLIIEVDGITHSYEEVVLNDEKRTSDLENHGFTVLRYTDEEVLQHIEYVQKSINQWIEDNATVPPPSPRQRGIRNPKK